MTRRFLKSIEALRLKGCTAIKRLRKLKLNDDAAAVERNQYLSEMESSIEGLYISSLGQAFEIETKFNKTATRNPKKTDGAGAGDCNHSDDNQINENEKDFFPYRSMDKDERLRVYVRIPLYIRAIDIKNELAEMLGDYFNQPKDVMLEKFYDISRLEWHCGFFNLVSL